MQKTRVFMLILQLITYISVWLPIFIYQFFSWGGKDVFLV